jgi:lipopolysaccharide export LptBFGC system permease protein LptF
MSRTLFWYIFKDLMRVFGMASGALSGIMSFVALLRPLTQNGLDGIQVLLLLRYFSPAMSTYSIPVAALFATTVVYGRMSADNEITACRASGMSFLALAVPAVLLGSLVAILSLYLLCFTVPEATRKGEQVVYSNLAKLIAHQIEQTHQTGLGDFAVFARGASLPPMDQEHPDDQQVVLDGPLIVTYYTPVGMPKWYHCAKEFWSARSATAHIHENPEDSSAQLTVTLQDGVYFPRDFSTAAVSRGGVATAQFGPVKIPSPMAEKTKFLSVSDLKRLQADPSQGQEVRTVLSDFIREDQAKAVIAQVLAQLQGGDHRCVFKTDRETYSLQSPDVGVSIKSDVLTLTAPTILFRQESDGQIRETAAGAKCVMTVKADPENDQAFISLDMPDAQVDSGESATSNDFARRFTLPLPPEIAAFKNRTVNQYLGGTIRNSVAMRKLQFAFVDLLNHIISELNGRAAFVVSCMLLVLIGSSLGMMFRSGNFLTAFAVSVIPAMVSTVLIVTGQHTVESTPENPLLASPVTLGISIIWSGNVLIGISAMALLVRLQRR